MALTSKPWLVLVLKCVHIPQTGLKTDMDGSTHCNFSFFNSVQSPEKEKKKRKKKVLSCVKREEKIWPVDEEKMRARRK